MGSQVNHLLSTSVTHFNSGALIFRRIWGPDKPLAARIRDILADWHAQNPTVHPLCGYSYNYPDYAVWNSSKVFDRDGSKLQTSNFRVHVVFSKDHGGPSGYNVIILRAKNGRDKLVACPGGDAVSSKRRNTQGEEYHMVFLFAWFGLKEQSETQACAIRISQRNPCSTEFHPSMIDGVPRSTPIKDEGLDSQDNSLTVPGSRHFSIARYCKSQGYENEAVRESAKSSTLSAGPQSSLITSLPFFSTGTLPIQLLSLPARLTLATGGLSRVNHDHVTSHSTPSSLRLHFKIIAETNCTRVFSVAENDMQTVFQKAREFYMMGLNGKFALVCKFPACKENASSESLPG